MGRFTLCVFVVFRAYPIFLEFSVNLLPCIFVFGCSLDLSKEKQISLNLVLLNLVLNWYASEILF